MAKATDFKFGTRAPRESPNRTPNLGEEGGRRGSRMVPFERAFLYVVAFHSRPNFSYIFTRFNTQLSPPHRLRIFP